MCYLKIKFLSHGNYLRSEKKFFVCVFTVYELANGRHMVGENWKLFYGGFVVFVEIFIRAQLDFRYLRKHFTLHNRCDFS